MVHWAFLPLAFLAGFLACYGLLYVLAKANSGFTAWLPRNPRGR